MKVTITFLMLALTVCEWAANCSNPEKQWDLKLARQATFNSNPTLSVNADGISKGNLTTVLPESASLDISVAV